MTIADHTTQHRGTRTRRKRPADPVVLARHAVLARLGITQAEFGAMLEPPLTQAAVSGVLLGLFFNGAAARKLADLGHVDPAELWPDRF